MLNTIGKPKIIGSLMLKSPGATDKAAICVEDFTLLNRKAAMINDKVQPDPPIMA